MPRAVIDTSVLFAAVYRRDSAHQDALPILQGIDDGSLPDAVVLDYVLAETLNALRTRRPRRGPRPSGPHRGEHTLPRRLALRRRAGRRESPVSASRPLSFVDACLVAYARTADLEYLYAFDDDFDVVNDVPVSTRPQIRTARVEQYGRRGLLAPARPDGSISSGPNATATTSTTRSQTVSTSVLTPSRTERPGEAFSRTTSCESTGSLVYRSRTGRRRRQSGGDRRLRRVSRSAWVRGDGQSSKKWVSDTEVIGFEKRLTPQQPIGSTCSSTVSAVARRKPSDRSTIQNDSRRERRHTAARHRIRSELAPHASRFACRPRSVVDTPYR